MTPDHHEVFASGADRLPPWGGLVLFGLMWSVLVLHLFLLDVWVAERFGAWLPLPAAVCVYCALFADARALPVVLLPAAAARALMLESPLPVEILALGVPVALLLPLRPWLHQAVAYQWAAGFLAVVALPRLSMLFSRVAGGALVTPSVPWWEAVVAVLLVPLCVAGIRRLPPLNRLQQAELRGAGR